MEVKFIELNEETALENVNMGIRVDYEKYNLGDSLPDSYNWLETEVLPKEEWENARLDGTCAVSMSSTFWYDDVDELKSDIIKSLKFSSCNNYIGDYFYLISGSSSNLGTDPGEVIIRNAKVVGIFEIVK